MASEPPLDLGGYARSAEPSRRRLQFVARTLGDMIGIVDEEVVREEGVGNESL